LNSAAEECKFDLKTLKTPSPVPERRKSILKTSTEKLKLKTSTDKRPDPVIKVSQQVR
jgi:hypothetical protein